MTWCQYIFYAAVYTSSVQNITIKLSKENQFPIYGPIVKYFTDNMNYKSFKLWWIYTEYSETSNFPQACEGKILFLALLYITATP